MSKIQRVTEGFVKILKQPTKASEVVEYLGAKAAVRRGNKGKTGKEFI